MTTAPLPPPKLRLVFQIDAVIGTPVDLGQTADMAEPDLGVDIHVLGNLDKPATLGPSISAAFVATLIGVASANVIYLPISARLKQLSQDELHARALIVEGILSIQAGDNPRVVQEKLITFVPPALRVDADGNGNADAASKAAA